MRYEMIFGDEKLFAGVPEYVEFIRYNSYSRDYLWGDLNVMHHLTFKDLTALPIVAMRRIIKEPKRWTFADQKAGRLPEVGNEVQFNFYQSAVIRQGVIKYIDDQVVIIQTEDVTRPFCYETCKVVFTPLETPEEKQERLRRDWCQSALRLINDEMTDACDAAVIYDALLSGTLSVPTKRGE